MKGVIAIALKEMVIRNFGLDKWEEILMDASLPVDLQISSSQDIEDYVIMRVISSACKVLDITPEQAADAFGDYWVNEYAFRIYAAHYEGIGNSKDFLKRTNQIHTATTLSIPNAHPPKFEYEDPGDNTLIMTYLSNRGLMNIFIGLVRASGKHFNEELQVERIDDNKVKITFPE